MANLSAQRDKAQLAFSKDKSELLTRRADLIAQLDDMQLKCKVILCCTFGSFSAVA